jgi:glycerol-3-phosphate dehydrogenase (NAD+)
MGANIALDIGLGQLSEATIGFKIPENADVFAKLFQSPTFNVTPVQDVEGAEMCGTLKNIVAVAAGLSDGLDYGSNTKAAIIRQGLSEIRLLSKKMFPSVRDETFLESCGVAGECCLFQD